MQLNTYLLFDGRCEAAFRFYERCLEGKIEAMISHAGTPMEKHVAPEWREKIMHASLAVGNERLMGSDVPPGDYKEPKGFSVSISVKDTAAAERIFNALAENGKIGMPLQSTFWAARFGMLVDQFGVPWMINCEGSAQQG